VKQIDMSFYIFTISLHFPMETVRFLVLEFLFFNKLHFAYASFLLIEYRDEIYTSHRQIF